MWVWGLGLAVVAAYWLIPEVLGHHGQVGAFVGSGQENRMALTFDDGPGPDTPAVLAALRAAGVRATFFVIAERAVQHPELVLQMAADGHEVALHGWHHRSALTMAPWTAWREVARGRQLVAQITGEPPRFYRPPWGHHNLVTWIVPHWLGLRRILWSIAPDDWRIDRSSEAIAAHVVRHALPGAVVVLHDAGGDRSRTVAALPRMIAGIRRLGLEPVPVAELRQETSWVRKVWTWWEGIFTRRGQIETIPAPDGGPPVLRVGRAVYRGPELSLPDGSRIRRGATMAEIHFHNYTLGQDSGGRASGVRAWVRVAKSLPGLGEAVATHPHLADAVVVGGVTVLDVGNAVERLGFHRVSVSGIRMLPMRIYLIFLMAVFHRQGFSVLTRARRLKPVLIYMSRDELRQRYPAPNQATGL